ncbi:Cell division cycle protein cdt2 [Cyphellophora attinorum]|uniref:Cell division cycle protein cdt2 n=1 Tax=Cyphellophora attinorum TaxID=1664694 RepID=A0A0N1H360_9EURO|nr:Cell division cycle protein cdt2 [Phialophora attinorum]KPI39197.1 Cell division cycle protein cdt2 [Phialophora attinorum]
MDQTPKREPRKVDTRHEVVRFDLTQSTPTPSPKKPENQEGTAHHSPPLHKVLRSTTSKDERCTQDHQDQISLKDVSETELNTRQNESAGRASKRRKLSFSGSLISSSLPSSPVKHSQGFLSSSQDYGVNSDDDGDAAMNADEHDSEASTDIEERPQPSYSRRKPYSHKSLSARLLATRLDGRSIRRAPAVGGALWQDETAAFYSAPEDVNIDHGLGPEYRRRYPNLPFCSTSCKTNSLVAIGDEEGYVRLIDTAKDHQHEFSKTYLVLKPHDNAIMDLEFSQDDHYLATASGDQTCQIIDVPAQKSIWTLSSHSCSVKKVQFQPDNPNILASCARDGTINIWDTRQNPSSTMPPRQVTGPLTDTMTAQRHTRGATFSGRSDFSVTSLAFLDASRPNLIATASESDAVVKLWDIRSKHSFRNKTVPISCTTPPSSHSIHRHFGITSMAVSTDASKIYTLCRDHTVYAYSTSHLILGSKSASSLLDHPTTTPPFSSMRNGASTGLGPLYGFRDPSMAITTFYLKLSLRKSTASQSELLAIGSSDHCAVLFPTAERYLTKAARNIPRLGSVDAMMSMNAANPTGRLRLTRTDSQSTSLALKARASEDDVPIYYTGTPLVRGHVNEVTSVTWSSEGSLVTISDDLTARCWREEPENARAMRQGWQKGGEVSRYGAGWAAVRDAGYDDDAI